MKSHYTIRCLSLEGRVYKISVQDLSRKLKNAPNKDTVRNFEFFMKHKANTV